MKQLALYIFMLLLFASCRTAKQTKVISSNNNEMLSGNDNPPIITDSLANIKSIVNNKEKYLNKPLGVLLKDLNLNIESYSSDYQNRVTSYGITIGFNNSTYLDDNGKRINGILIIWKTPISRALALEQLKKAGGKWGTADENFYSKLIVGDIK